jgi:sec-independent protein translocase protein TatA
MRLSAGDAAGTGRIPFVDAAGDAGEAARGGGEVVNVGPPQPASMATPTTSASARPTEVSFLAPDRAPFYGRQHGPDAPIRGWGRTCPSLIGEYAGIDAGLPHEGVTMGAIQPWHLILVLIIVLLVVGPGKLPEVGKSVGDAIREFRKATTESHDAPALPPAPGPASATPLTPPVGTSAPTPPAPAAPAIEPPEARPPQ